MNQDVKQLWITALRSGEFTQGTVRLKTPEDGRYNHCCLGVLCELHDRQVNCPQSFENYAGELPDHVMRWAGLEENNPYMNRPEGGFYRSPWRTHISVLNDIEGLNFNQLADLIEQQL